MFKVSMGLPDKDIDGKIDTQPKGGNTMASVADAIIANLSIGIVYLDGDGRIALINPEAEAMLHTSAAEVMGKRVDMLPLRTPGYRVLSENCRETTVEISINGTVLAARSAEMPASAGDLPGEIFELHDVTEEKKEKRQREEIVAMTIHDLKSPLTVLMGYIQAIKGEGDTKLDASLQPCLDEMDRSAMKLLSMIEDVLDAYRLEVGLMQTTCSWCDLTTILQACCQDLAREAVARGSKLNYVIEDPIPQMNVDGNQLARVFANLIGNAVKFTPRKGTISVRAQVQQEKLRVSVQDTGIGIPEKDLPRIFNKYYRSSSATGFKGTGLGLTISKAIVEAHGGTIDVDSVAGEGSRFTVTLPCSAPKVLPAGAE